MQDKELLKEDDKGIPTRKDRVDRLSVETATKGSEPAFAAVWDNPDDAEYDDL